MQFSTSIVLAALAGLVSAGANPFTLSATTLSEGLTAGSSVTITWTPTSSGTVTLLLKQGDPDNLDTVSTIAANTENSGSFVWTPSTSLVKGSDYALEIVDDTDTSSVNYSGEFPINSSNTVSASTQSSTATSASSTSASSKSSATGSSSTTASSISTKTGSSSIATATASSSKNATTTLATKTTSSSSTPTSASASSASSAATFEGSGMRIKVGGSMLALVGAVMVAL